MSYTLSPINSYETTLNYILIGIGLLFGFIYRTIIFSDKSLYVFKIIWIYLFINLFYQLTFGWTNFKFDDVFYLLSKTAFVFILCLSILINTNHYFNKFYFYLGIFITVLFVFGYLFDNQILRDRSFLGFGNPNTAGALAAIGFGIVLLYPKINRTVKLLCLFILLSAVLLTGSRSAIIITILSIIFYLRLNVKTLFLGFLFLFFTFVFFQQFELNIPGINRLVASFNVDEGYIVTNREGEFELGVRMFQNKFWTGYGLTGYKIVDRSLGPYYLDDVLGTHNGYLAAAKMYGAIFLTLFIFTILIRPLLLIKKLIKVNNSYLKIHLFVVLSVLIGANAEDYIVGVNSFVTVLFFISLAIIEMYSKMPKAEFDTAIKIK